jgi:hypothetical protein
MIDVSPDLQAIAHQRQLLAEARQARLVAQLRAPRDGQLSPQRSALGTATQKAPAGSSAFDAAVRQLATRLSRRGLWGVASAIALSTTTLRLPAMDAKKRKKAKKLQRNSFGCVDVGKPCRGNSANCCSGICQGKKPKKGEKDKSTCVAHNVGGCLANQDLCLIKEAVSCGASERGVCARTTGNASFCGDFENIACFDCTKDTDCEAEFGTGAACVICAGECELTGNRICVASGT